VDQLRVLVVDDHVDTADMLCVELEMQGHDCRSALLGAEGIAIAETFDPHVVILDIGLPDMTGHEVARELRRQERARRVIVALTARARPEDRAHALATSFDGYLVKPVAVATLRLVMSRARAGTGFAQIDAVR